MYFICYFIHTTADLYCSVFKEDQIFKNLGKQGIINANSEW